jgi:hypothetical protein
VKADASDKVAADCEEAGVGISSRCSIRGRSLRMSRSGTVRVRVTCPVAARGTLTLRNSRAGKGRKSFRARAGRTTTVKVKLARKARRLVQRRKRLSFRATVVSRPRSGTGRRQRANKTLRVRAPRKK